MFAAYPIGVILMSPIIGNCLETTGRKFWIVGGLLIMGLIFLMFGILSLSDNPTLIFVIAFIARFL